MVAALTAKKAGVALPGDRPYTIAEFDELAAAAGLPVEHKLELKAAFLQAGLVTDGARRAIHAQAQPTAAAKSILDTLGLDAGKKHSVAAVDAAMKPVGWNATRTVGAKSTLAAAGAL